MTRAFVVMTGLILVACADKPAIHTTITGCEAFHIIRPSKQDTEDTKRQVLAHDLAYEKLCGVVK